MKPDKQKEYYDEFITWSKEKINAEVARALECKVGRSFAKSVYQCYCVDRPHGIWPPGLKLYSTSVDAVLEAVEGVGIKHYRINVTEKYQVVFYINYTFGKSNIHEWVDVGCFDTLALALCFAVCWYTRMKEGE